MSQEPNLVTVYVSKALRDHGMVHIAGLPEDEYDCCAEVAINAYEEWINAK